MNSTDKPRVLIVGLNYLPERVGVGKFTGEMAQFLADNGVEVSVVCGQPYYPQWRIHQGFSGWKWQISRERGVRVIRCPHWVPSTPRSIGRIVHLLSFGLSCIIGILLCGRIRPHWVIVLQPSLSSVPAALLCARVYKAKSWLHIQDFELGAAESLGMVRFPKIWKGLRNLEAMLYRRFDRVSTISLAMCESLLNRGLIPQRTRLIRNWGDCETINPSLPFGSQRSLFHLSNDEFIVLYSGTLNRKSNLELVIEAARLLVPCRRIRFVICGEGPLEQRLKMQAAGLENVRWLPSQDNESYAKLMLVADIHLLPQKAEVSAHVLPSKLAAMLASGRPVVATVEPGCEIAEIVDGCGIVCAPDDVNALTAAVQYLFDNPEDRIRFGRAGRVQAKQLFERERNLADMLFELKQTAVQASVSEP